MTARVWLNGRLLPQDEAHIAPNDRGLLLADGLFETMLVLNGRIVRLDRHLARLIEGAAVLGIPLPFETRTLRAAARETVEANGLLGTQRASVRLTLTRGPGGRGLALPETPEPTVLVTATAVGPAPRSLSVITSAVRRIATSPASPLKTLNYTDSIVARREADAADADDALLLSEADGIACASIGNVFVVKDGALTTPPDDGAIRPGIARADVLALAKDLGIRAEEAPVSRGALAAADEVFLTNSLIGACPVTTLDGESRPAGPVTKKLAQALEEAWARET